MPRDIATDRCPVCDSHNIDSEAITTDNDNTYGFARRPVEVYQHHNCDSCKSRWINRATAIFYETEVTHNATGGRT